MKTLITNINIILLQFFQNSTIKQGTSSCFSIQGNTVIMKSDITDEDISLILNLHNELRVNVRLGLEKRGISGPQPAALDSNYGIPALVFICYPNFF